MKELEFYIQNYFGIKGENLVSIGNLFSNSKLEKNDFLLKTNQYVKSIHFVKSGYLRVFAYAQNGEKEVTQWISSREMFLTDLSSFIFDTPSRWNIQALSNCELYTISKDNYQSIGNYVKNWSDLERSFIARCFVTLENRVFKQISMTAEEKVNDLIKTNPEIFLEVPLQYIASMLGISPETLSRVRRKMIS